MAPAKHTFLAQIGSAIVIALLVGGTAPWWWTELVGTKPSPGPPAPPKAPIKDVAEPPPAPPDPPKAAVKYVVTERNPFSGGVESAREFAEADHAAFTRECTERRKVHWVSWRYVGISEPMHSRRFATRAAAQGFIDDRGPLKMPTGPAIKIIDQAAAIVASRVACDTVKLPASSSGK